jgi:hypothetical protein
MQYHRDTTASQHNLAQMPNTEKTGKETASKASKV